MLTVIFGVSCVGKSTIIEQLLEHGCYPVRVYTTRALRNGEKLKIHVSDERFEQYVTQQKFVWVNQFFNTIYGTSNEDISKALSSDDVYLLDYALSRESDFEGMNCLKIILLPENLDALVMQIESSNRNERLDEILNEYNAYYNQEALYKYLDQNFKIVINLHSKPQYAITQIIQHIKKEANHGSIK